MRSLERWLDERRPEPPEELARELKASLEAGGHTGGEGFVELLTGVGRQRLARARARPGRVRESAFDLLAADALFSYACEAALESEDPEATLLQIVDAAAEP